MLRLYPGPLRLAALIVTLAAAPGLGAGPSEAASRVISVAAASDLEPALEALRPMFEASHPGFTLRVTYGSSGAFFAQIQSAAPFDVYLSADVAYARKLAELGLASPLDVFVYARGRLAIWAPKSSPIEVEALGLRSVLHPAAKRVAIANPRHAPYGRAAEAALRMAGLLDPVRPRLVYGENVAQAAQFVDSGAADLGLIALSLALSPALRDRGRIYEVPLDAYPSLEQGGVVLRSAREPEAARALCDFLLSGEAATTLRRFGFLVEER